MGFIDVLLPYGGDISFTPDGDVQLVADTSLTTDASYQLVVRVVMTTPRLFDVDGVAIGRADDLFNPDWGGGLPAITGEPDTPTLRNGVSSRILAALALVPTIATTPAPSVTVNDDPADAEITFGVLAFTSAGNTVSAPQISPSTGG